MAVTAAEAIDTTTQAFGSHPGFRALHAKGIVATAVFRPTAEAATLSRAAHIAGPGAGHRALLQRLGQPASSRLRARSPGAGGQAVPARRLAHRHRRRVLAALPDPHSRGVHRARPRAGGRAGDGLEAAALPAPSSRGARTAARWSPSAQPPASYATICLLRDPRVPLRRLRRRLGRYVRYTFVPEHGGAADVAAGGPAPRRRLPPAGDPRARRGRAGGLRARGPDRRAGRPDRGRQRGLAEERAGG